MGTHSGYVIQPRGSRFLARAWNPTASAYVCKTFDKEGEAKAWAKLKHAAFMVNPTITAKEKSQEITDKYIADLKRRGRAESHTDDVKVVLDRFCTEVKNLDGRTVLADTRAWLESLSAFAAPTRNRYAVTVKAMCRWAVRNDLLSKSPLEALDMESEPEPNKEQFSIDELRTMATAFDDPYHRRYCLQIYAGLRADEAAHLPSQLIDFSGKVIDIRLGDYRLKRQKERIVGLQDELAAILWEHRNRPGIVAPLTMKSTWREFVKFLDRLNIPKRKRSPHSLRHCYAGLLTATGMPSITVQSYMGHESGETTAEYSKLAVRYIAPVQGWARGQFQLIQGATCELKRGADNGLTPRAVDGDPGLTAAG